MSFLSYDHIIGGTGNNYIEWFNDTQFRRWRGERNALFGVYGIKQPEAMPKVGDTLFCEFKRSYILFKFVKVTLSPDQTNTFFGEVAPIKQIIKEGEDGNTAKLVEE